MDNLEGKNCFMSGLPASMSFFDGDGNEKFICKEIEGGARKLFEQYKHEDQELQFQDCIDSVLSNLIYEANKKLGFIKGKENEAFKVCQKPRSKWGFNFFGGKK